MVKTHRTESDVAEKKQTDFSSCGRQSCSVDSHLLKLWRISDREKHAGRYLCEQWRIEDFRFEL